MEPDPSILDHALSTQDLRIAYPDGCEFGSELVWVSSLGSVLLKVDCVAGKYTARPKGALSVAWWGVGYVMELGLVSEVNCMPVCEVPCSAGWGGGSGQ